jgi:drug/metabolite transporter (DMT)-like permease
MFPQYINPLAMTMLTLVVSGVICLLSFIWIKGERIDRRDFSVFAVAGLLMGVVKKGAMMVGMSDTTPIDAAIISTLGPVMVMILAAFLRIDKLTTRKILGIVMGIVGALIIVVWGRAPESAPDRAVGNLIILLSTFALSVYLVWARKIVKKYKTKTLLRWVYIWAGIFALPFTIYYYPHIDFQGFNTKAWWLFFYVLLVPTLLPNYIVLSSLRYVNPTLVSVYSYIMPVFAILLSVVLGQDTLSWERMLACIMVFVGVNLVVKAYKPKVRKSA